MEKIVLLAVLISAIIAMARFPDWPRAGRPVATKPGGTGRRRA
jgi:hypothetical protein